MTALERLIEPDLIGEPVRFPVSSAQERCWFINALNPGTSALNVALRFEIRGRLDARTIEAAFGVIVARHEALRTRIVDVDGAPLQDVLPPFDVTLTDIDLSALPEPERSDDIGRLGRIEAHRPFDLAEGPLLRITRLGLEPELALLLVTVHQVAFDGWSIRLIAREFGVIAAALAARRPHGLPELVIQYGDFCAWQAAFLASGQFERERNYWVAQLEGAPYFEVPGDRGRPIAPTQTSEILADLLPDRVAEAMTRAAQAKGVTLFSFGAAVIAAVLHRITGAADISIGTQVAGRDDPDLDPVIGVFINNLVLRFDLSGRPTFPILLERVNRTVQDALVHQRMPFHRLVALLKPPRDPRRMPLISVNFTVLQDVMENARYGAFELIGRPSLSAGSLYDLNFFMVHWSTGWRMAVEYNTDLFDKATAEAFLRLWRDTLGLATGSPDFALSDMPDAAIRTAAQPTVGAKAERALLDHRDVANAIVVDSPGGGQRAVVTLRPDYEGPLDQVSGMLLAYLRSRLLPAECPDGIALRIALPQQPDGSVDRAALAAAVVAAPMAPPATPGTEADRPDDGAVERLLIPIWQDILGVEAIGPTSHFFDLGGHSMLALQMVSAVSTALGRKVPVAILFVAPTLRGFARAIGGEAPSPPAWSIVRIQDGTGVPIISINNTITYHRLAKRLGPNRPLIGVQVFDPDGDGDLPPRDLEAIAGDYVALIRSAYPRGPYVLLGLCVAGAIAYEVARQMREAGDAVPLVIMADTWQPGFLSRMPPLRSLLFRSAYRCHVARHHFRMLWAGHTSVAAVLTTYPSLLRTGLPSLVGRMTRRGDYRRLGFENWRNRWFLPHLEAARDHYRARPAPGRVVVLQSDEMVTSFADDTMGWGGLVPDGLLMCRVPGWHTDMFQEPGAGVIAGCLAPLLAELDAASPRRGQAPA